MTPNQTSEAGEMPDSKKPAAEAAKAIACVMYQSGIGGDESLPHHAQDILDAIVVGKIPGVFFHRSRDLMQAMSDADHFRYNYETGCATISHLRAQLAEAEKERDAADSKALAVHEVLAKERDALRGQLAEAGREKCALFGKYEDAIKDRDRWHQRVSELYDKIDEAEKERDAAQARVGGMEKLLTDAKVIGKHSVNCYRHMNEDESSSCICGWQAVVDRIKAALAGGAVQ